MAERALLPKANVTKHEWNRVAIAARGEMARTRHQDSREWGRINRVMYLYDSGDLSPSCYKKLAEIAAGAEGLLL